MAKFQKKFPKHAKIFFNPASDEAFRRRHPVGYWFLVALGITGLLLPNCVLIVFTEVLYPAPNSGFLVLGFVGCFIIGTGIFNLVAAIIDQYLGHLVTIGCFSLGGLITAISLVILYVPEVYAQFDEAMVTYYFVSLLFLCLPPIYYMFFRYSVGAWLQWQNVTKRDRRTLTKGMRNFWWYEELHQKYGLGAVYHLNKWGTILYMVTLGLSLFFGWLRVIAPLISGLYALLSLTTAGMSLFASIQDHLEQYGTPIVLFRRNSRRGVDSILSDLFAVAFVLAAGYCHIVLMLGLI